MASIDETVPRRTILAGLALGMTGAGMSGALASSPKLRRSPVKIASATENRMTFHTTRVGDVEVFHREAGPKDAPVILLLHGFPTSGHMFRDLMPALSDQYRVIAPDLPGFGNTVAPRRGEFEYSFDNLAKVIEGFVDALGLKRYAIYIFDYGAPTGLRLAMRYPERVSAIVTQNGNAYVEGLSDVWGPFQAYWRDPSPSTREACRQALTDDAIKFQYAHGTPPELLSPDGWMLDQHYMHRPDAQEIQLDLVLSYRTNVTLYPEFHKYFRAHRPPLLAAWGRNDPFFIPPGAEAYRKDLPDAEVHFFDTGHFALETHHAEIASLMRMFLAKHR